MSPVSEVQAENLGKSTESLCQFCTVKSTVALTLNKREQLGRIMVWLRHCIGMQLPIYDVEGACEKCKKF